MSPAKRLVLAFPGDLATRTGGYLYDRRLARELEARGWEIRLLSLSSRFPFPDGDDLGCRGARPGRPRPALHGSDRRLGAGCHRPAVAARAASRLRLVALVHHPLCLETGLSSTQAARLAAGERAALASVRSVIVTSGHTAAALRQMFEVPPGVIAVAPPAPTLPRWLPPRPTAGCACSASVR